MKYKGKELDVFKSDENIAFNPPHRMLVWDDVMNNPVVEYVAAFCPSRLHAVIINDGGVYQHCAEIPKVKTNWDVYQERYGADKLPLKDAIDLIERHGMFCILCQARKWCNTGAGNPSSCTETFKTWANAGSEEEK